VASTPAYSYTSDTKTKTSAIETHLFVHPPLEFLVIHKATFLPERSLDRTTGPFSIPPTAEPTG
jgi:hypothetical protein